MTRNSIGVFLDRDGTINEEIDFLTNVDELRLIEGAGQAIRRLNEHGFITCVMSNQSGVARGILTEETLGLIHGRLAEYLGADGARLDAIYYCPHHPAANDERYKRVCECRKPRPGMLLQGAQEFNIDLSRSFAVGDRTTDILAGQAAGTKTILVLTGYGRAAEEECRSLNPPVDFVAPSISGAVDFILNEGRAVTSDVS